MTKPDTRATQSAQAPLTLLDVDEAAAVLHTSAWAVRKAIQRGRLRSYKPGRKRLISIDDLKAYLERSASRPRRSTP